MGAFAENETATSDPSDLVRFYSHDYFEARDRFRSASSSRHETIISLPIDAPSPNSESLTIDVAVLGADKPMSALVLSSGLHGVEGLFGSAVQLAALDRKVPGWHPPNDAAIILLHALNPFGYAWLRRFNEENVDLNRNFLLPGDEYAGAPPLAGAFRKVLMPHRSRLSIPFWSARLGYLAMRHGVRSFWENVPVGQYDYPDWLFFGGNQRTQTALALDRLLPSLLGAAEEVIHLDFHTGLGKWASYKLLLPENDSDANVDWWNHHFGAENVRASTRVDREYQIRGGLGTWLQARFPQCRYRFATAEFGTYSPVRAIQALANELHWSAKLGAPILEHHSRQRLSEVFVPKNLSWRATTLGAALAMVERSATTLWPSK